MPDGCGLEEGASEEDVTEAILALGMYEFKKPTLIDRPPLGPDFNLKGSVNDLPDWLYRYGRHFLEISVISRILSKVLGRKPTEKLRKAEKEFGAMLDRVRNIMKGNPDKATAECLDILLDLTAYELHKTVVALISIWKRERKGMKRGFAGKADSWLDEFDNYPEWMERHGNRWRVSREQILRKLGAIGKYELPSASTISRERSRRTQSAK